MRILSYIIETAASLYFFYELTEKRKSHFIPGLIAFLALRALLYIPGLTGYFMAADLNDMLLPEQLFRLLIRLFSTVILLAGVKTITLPSILYWSGFETVLHLSCMSVRACTNSFISLHGQNIAGIDMSFLLVECLVYYVARRHIEVREPLSIGPTRIIELLLNTVMHLAIKWSINGSRFEVRTNVIFLGLVSVFGLTYSLVAFEHNQQMKERQLRMVVEKLELDSELANARRVRQANSDVRRLYHDLKNHLLAIQNLAGDQKELRTYVDSLMPELENYGRQLQTGNEIVDALLSEKMRATANLGIHFHVQMDLRPLSFMQSVDLVSLFGNAIDNAIEAVSSCPDAESRYVYLKSRTQEDMLFLRVENPYTGERSRLADQASRLL